MSGAYIQDGTIDNAKIGLAAIKEANIDDLSVSSAKIADGSITSLKIGNVLQSDNFGSNGTGWRILRSGQAEFNNGIFRGNVYVESGTIASNVTIDGLGAFAYKSSLFYDEVSGTKPPTDADNTGSNTSADTNALAGTAATTVRDQAANAGATTARVNSWVRPNSTLIDGNKIFTGDAYVDTLQIKGNAVTVPAGGRRPNYTSTNNSWKTIASFTYDHEEDFAIGGLVTAYITMYMNNSATTQTSYGVAIYVNNALIEIATAIRGFAYHINLNMSSYVLLPTGSYDIELRARTGVAGNAKGSIAVIGGKR